MVTNATGAMPPEQDIEYHPYGEQQVYTDTLGQQYKFTGKEHDPETNNDYFGARYYSSTMGRFLTPDWAATPVPIPYAVMGNPQTLNLYSYVENNPITSTDPDGHTEKDGSTCEQNKTCDGKKPDDDARAAQVANEMADREWGALVAKGGQEGGSAKATAQNQMSVSQKGQDFIKGYEKLSLTVYDAHPPHGDWTIGYGHKVESNDVPPITKEQAEKLFSQDVARMAAHVNSDLKVSVTQNQFDALVSLRFNAGANNVTPPVSDLNRTGHATMEDFTNHYITAGGIPMRGLRIRRAAEWEMFSQGVYDATH